MHYCCDINGAQSSNFLFFFWNFLHTAKKFTLMAFTAFLTNIRWSQVILSDWHANRINRPIGGQDHNSLSQYCLALWWGANPFDFLPYNGEIKQVIWPVGAFFHENFLSMNEHWEKEEDLVYNLCHNFCPSQAIIYTAGRCHCCRNAPLQWFTFAKDR